MTVPVLIAWAAPSLVEIDDRGTWGYAHLFELIVGASGFTSQARHFGMVACPCDVLTPTDGSVDLIDFRIRPSDDPALYSMGDTFPHDLLPWQEQIMDSYAQQNGSICETAEG